MTCENFLGIAGEIEEQINNRLVFWMICKNMKVIGIDFTSRPTKFKPLTCAICDFDDETLMVKRLAEWPDFEHFENFLITSGPWVAGIDFPFGQSRKFIKNIHWPNNWSVYVKLVAKMKRDELSMGCGGLCQRFARDLAHPQVILFKRDWQVCSPMIFQK